VIGPARLPVDFEKDSPEQAASDILNDIESRECLVDRLGPDRDHHAVDLLALAWVEDRSGLAVAGVE
jgi:hypothetical protein